MSETYGFGYYDGETGEESIEPPQPEPNQTIKALRAKADKDSQALKDMRAELDQLRQRARQADVAEVLRAKGYDPGVAKLYQGEPDKVDEWLTAHGSLLAKTPEGGVQEQVIPQGPPASTVSAESQAQQQRMQSAGGEEAPALGSQDELAAALRATTNPADFQKIAQANGWGYTTDGLFG